jgi:hypothetical protein
VPHGVGDRGGGPADADLAKPLDAGRIEVLIVVGDQPISIDWTSAFAAT